jgi:hypothetical protein
MMHDSGMVVIRANTAARCSLCLVKPQQETGKRHDRSLARSAHRLLAVPTVAGAMNAIQFHEDGTMSGAACWRADGTPVGIAGELARAGVRFELA